MLLGKEFFAVADCCWMKLHQSPFALMCGDFNGGCVNASMSLRGTYALGLKAHYREEKERLEKRFLKNVF